MKLFFALTLLILSTLLYEVQGINRKVSEKPTSSTITSTVGTNFPGFEKKGKKKHLTEALGYSNIKPYFDLQNNKNEGKKSNPQLKIKSTRESFSIRSSPSNVVKPPYQDVVDVVELDYSPPKINTPIHN
ncbi:uncharacterized protein LOC118479920 isoform X1 [Helianthus annuus]|uniref:uncharacterized protein LOC118479920 isoform X1 n=1 Tax=Helianthus annuus TaxID=4232 RepID=UPI001652CF48|nr:uncharacterized protein LOC118479920 isoform X1 [Helianthus annuus]